MVDIKVMSLDNLIKKLTRVNDWNDFQIVFLLGAGCSRSSGIPGAQELASHWLREIREDNPQKFPSLTDDNASSNYFEIFNERFQESERKPAIDRFIKSAYPGLGYVIFTNLLASADKWGNKNKKRFNMILTTNFDNLIEQAFIVYTSERPVVIPDHSLIGFLKDVNSISVVKIHGDSRYAPRNQLDTVDELPGEVIAAISESIGRGVLIVLGYAGAENGVAKLIGKLVSDNMIKQIWWVDAVPPGYAVQSRLPGLFTGFFHVKHADFDEFMLRLKHEIENVRHASATRMDEHIFKYHDRLMWRFGLYGRDGRSSIAISDSHFTDYFRTFAKAAVKLEELKPDDALRELTLGLEQHSQSANYHALLGGFYKAIMNNRKEALIHLKKAKELAPEHSGARAALANLLKELSTNSETECNTIISEFEAAEEFDPLNINNSLNYAGFLLALDREEYNEKGREKLKQCAESLYEPQHKMELAFYIFAHNIGGFDRSTHLKELQYYLSKSIRSPRFDLSWNVKKAEHNNHKYIDLVCALAIAINSDPSESQVAVLNSLDTVLKTLETTP